MDAIKQVYNVISTTFTFLKQIKMEITFLLSFLIIMTFKINIY